MGIYDRYPPPNGGFLMHLWVRTGSANFTCDEVN